MTITLDRPLQCFTSDRGGSHRSETADRIVRIGHNLEKKPSEQHQSKEEEESYEDRPPLFHPVEDSTDDWTVSTASSSDEYDVSSGCSSSSRKAVVTFSDELVSQVWTRPRTPTEDVRKLFYSSEDTQRFRQEYRFERKRAEEGKGSQNVSSMASKTHRIHRVVVLHKDIQQTFVEPDDVLCSPSHKDYSSVTCTTTSTTSTCCYASSQDFFDNDSFWSGQITWY
jgi:hypothetical protein